MAQTKREMYQRKRQHLRDLVQEGEIDQVDADAILEWCDAYDGENATATPNSSEKYVGDKRWGKSRAPTTLRQWIIGVACYAREVEGSIFEADADQLNVVSQAMKDGKADVLSDRAKKNGGLSKSSISTRQNCLKKFLQHYDDRVGAVPSDIHVFDREGNQIDPEDMLTEEEFHALRTAPEHKRDLAIVNLFLYTGQRNHAIRTLRVKDVKLEDGTYRLNSEVDGLKGADVVATWNPLLGATKAVRDWLNDHPTAPNPDEDAYLITDRRDRSDRDPYSTISDDTVNRVLQQAAEAAAEEYPSIARKPTNAHAMRHNFVTMCKVRYDMDDGTIKRLIRHKPDSTVMETTYAHLSDEDYIEKAERAFGIRGEDDEEEEFDASPEFCDVCDEPLQRGAKACPGCGTVYAPDAMPDDETLADRIKEVIREEFEKSAGDENGDIGPDWMGEIMSQYVEKMFADQPPIVIDESDLSPEDREHLEGLENVMKVARPKEQPDD